MLKSLELKQKRKKLIEDSRKLLDLADAEKRSLTAEENEQYGRMEADIESSETEIRRLEKLEARELEIANAKAEKVDAPEVPEVRSDTKVEYRKALVNYMRKGLNGIMPEEVRALQVGTDSEGGYITAEEFEKQIVLALAEENIFRKIAKVITTGSDRNIPIESSISTAAWIAEEGAFGTSSDPVFARVTLSAYKAGLIVKVSEELMQDSIFDVESYVAGEIGRAIGILEEAAFAAGDGSGKPTGANGGTAGVTAASTSAITSDELIDLYHSVDRNSRAKGTFVMKDSTLKVTRKLKDGDNQYMWQPGLQAGEPDKLLGKPLYSCDGLDAIGAAKKVILFGDFSKYVIADRKGMTVQRLNELYAANGQIGIRVQRRVDGKLLQADAVKHLIMAAS